MKTPKIISIAALVSGIAALSYWYSQNHGLLPVAAADEATIYDGLFNALIAIAAGLFLLIQFILIYSLIYFRRRPGDTTDGPPIHDNFLLETVWTAIPTITVIWIALSSFDVYNVMHYGRPAASTPFNDQQNYPVQIGTEAQTAPQAMLTPKAINVADVAAVKPDPSKRVPNPLTPPADTPIPRAEKPLEIDVNGLQFAWVFTYPNTDIVTSELHVPVGHRVRLNITAQDVIHSFWVPQFRVKQDAIPGTSTYVEFTASKVGEYPVVCAELCGSYHGGMRTQIIVQEPDAYENWLQTEQATASKDSDRRVAALIKDPATQTTTEFLADRDRDLKDKMGINADVLHQVQQLKPQSASLHHHMH